MTAQSKINDDVQITTSNLKGTNMRRIYVSAFAVTLLLPGLAAAQAPAGGKGKGAQSPEAKAAAAKYAVADIRVMTPGVVYNAGLLDLAAAYEKETGKKVGVSLVGMGGIVNAVRTANPPADVIMLPFELMSTLSLDGGVVPGSFMPLGRSEMGLAVPAGKPHPDISTVEKLAAVLRSAKAVMRSNPAGGSMVAKVIEDKVIKRPEFAGVNSPVSTQGEGGRRWCAEKATWPCRRSAKFFLTSRSSSWPRSRATSRPGSTCPRRFRPERRIATRRWRSSSTFCARRTRCGRRRASSGW